LSSTSILRPIGRKLHREFIYQSGYDTGIICYSKVVLLLNVWLVRKAEREPRNKKSKEQDKKKQGKQHIVSYDS